jgi:hypothetical protein
MSKKQIYLLIAQILSLDYQKDKIHEIAQLLPKQKEDWEKFVHLASNHLVLQTIYCSLKRNNLTSFLPKDLNEYLQYVYNLNVERNQKIVQQAKLISNILQRDVIATVFMKGVGNIFDGLYNHIGERIIYDIDILVEEGEIISAAEALIESGYKSQKSFNPKASQSTMHYPILVNEDFVAGVEIHRLPVQYQYINAFRRERVFESKKKSAFDNDLWVMSDSNKAIHNFIHSQLMHNGHYHADVSLRDLYDLLLLSQRIDIDTTFRDFGHFVDKSNAYASLMLQVFQQPKPKSLKKTITAKFFLLRNSLTLRLSGKQMALYHLVINATIKYIALPVRMIFSKNARNYVFSRLSRKNWYREHVNAYKRKYLKAKVERD